MTNHNRKSGHMSFSFRRLIISVFSLLAIVAGTQVATAALTIGALTVRSDSTLNSSGAATSLSEYADLNTTGNVTLGKAVTAGNITLGNASSTSGIIVLQSGATTTNAVNVTANALTTGNGMAISTTALTEGSSVSITSGTARTSGAAIKVTDGSLAASVTDALVQLDVTGTKDTNTLDIDVSGAAAASGNEIDITYSTSAHTGNAIDLNMGTNVAGDGINIGGAATTGDAIEIAPGTARTTGAAIKITDAGVAATTDPGGDLIQIDVTGTPDTNILDIDVTGGIAGNVIDITSATATSSGNLVDLNIGNLNDTGDAINVSMGAAAVAAQGLVMTTSAGIRTQPAVELTESNTTGTVSTIKWSSAQTRGGFLDIDTSGAFGTENLIDITTGAQAWTSNLIDINAGAGAATGDAININLGATAVASQALVVTSTSSTATDGLVDLNLTTIANQSADAVDINVTSGIMDGSDTVQGIDIDVTGANHTGFNVINGIGLSLATADDDATETAILIEGNWDSTIAGGTASSNNNGPAIGIKAGEGSLTGTGTGGRLTLQGGDGGGAVSGNGGAGERVDIFGGQGNGTSSNSGGDVRIFGGNRSGNSAAFGTVVIGDASNAATSFNSANAPTDPRESLYIEGRLEIGGNLTDTAAAAGSTWGVLTLPAKTYTLTGGTQVTTATGFNVVTIGQSTVTDATALTIDQSATLYLANAPAAGGSVTITNPYALWVDAGASRFDGILIQTPQALAVADNGNGGTAAAATLTVTGGVVEVTCSDAQGCDITMSETGAKSGQSVKIVNISSNVANFADTAGVSELPIGFAAGQYDSIELLYSTDRWVQVAKSDN